MVGASPTNFVDFLFDFQRLQVIEFRFMRLEFGIKFKFGNCRNVLVPVFASLGGGGSSRFLKEEEGETD